MDEMNTMDYMQLNAGAVFHLSTIPLLHLCWRFGNRHYASVVLETANTQTPDPSNKSLAIILALQKNGVTKLSGKEEP